MEISEFLNQGWRDHSTAPEQVAGRLSDGISLLTGPGQASRLAALAAHVYGEHLGRWYDGMAYLARLSARPTTDATDQRAIARCRAALQYCAGQHDSFKQSVQAAVPPHETSATTQVQILTQAAAALVGQSRIADASRTLDAALALAASPALPAARALAVTGNNLSWELEEKTSRSQDEDEMMVRAAKISRKYWGIAGGWLEMGRAEHRISRSLSASGQGGLALFHAEACLQICEDNSADAMERFFAHEARARANHALQDTTAAAEARQQAATLLSTLDEDTRGCCAEILSQVDGLLSSD